MDDRTAKGSEPDRKTFGFRVVRSVATARKAVGSWSKSRFAEFDDTNSSVRNVSSRSSEIRAFPKEILPPFSPRLIACGSSLLAWPRRKLSLEYEGRSANISLNSLLVTSFFTSVIDWPEAYIAP